jgi:hypothetical protein
MNLRDYLVREVRLTDERLAHIHEHAEMTGLDAAIAETLSAPRLVIQSLSDPTAALNYRFTLARGLATNGFGWWSNTARWTRLC